MRVNVIIRILGFISILLLVKSCKIDNDKDFYKQTLPSILDSYFSYKLKYVAPKYDSISKKIIEIPFEDADRAEGNASIPYNGISARGDKNCQ